MGGFTFVKLMTVSFNLLIFLSGLTMLALGIWTSLNDSFFLQLLAPFGFRVMQTVNVSYFSIATGALMALLGLLGCCGAHQESKCQLLTSFSIILIIFMAEAAAAVVTLAYSSFAEWILSSWATPSLQTDYGSSSAATDVWNATMTQLSCCGFNNYTDFVGSMFENVSGGFLPLSCCGTNSSTCSRDEAQLSAVQGCATEILKVLTEHASVVGSIAAGIGILEVGAMGVSLYLYFHLDNNDHGDSLKAA